MTTFHFATANSIYTLSQSSDGEGGTLTCLVGRMADVWNDGTVVLDREEVQEAIDSLAHGEPVTITGAGGRLMFRSTPVVTWGLAR